MYFMVSVGYFLLFFFGLELVIVFMVCFVVFDKYKGYSVEVGVKFIFLVLFFSGIFFYGIFMIYGIVGILYFEDIFVGLIGILL